MNYHKKALEDLYSNVSGRYVPPRRSLQVENISIYSKDSENSSEYEKIGTVDENEYSKIKRYIKRTSGGEVVDSLINLSGFTSQQRWFNQFLEEFDINYGEMSELVNSKQALTLITSKLNGVEGDFSIKEVVLPVIDKLILSEGNIDKEKFYNILFARTFAEGQVGVGKGELLLSLLTECFKGNVGDLKTPSGLNIELKVGQGRIVSARSGGFKRMRDKISELVNKPDLSVEDILSVEDSPFGSFKNKDNVNKFINLNIKNPGERAQYLGGLMLDAYSSHGGGFDYILFVYQKGFSRKAGVVMDEGTYDRARYLNVSNFDNILKAIKNKSIAFKFDGEGVYIGYPGSNTTAGFDKEFML
jgi:hypothetical protein